MMKQCPRCKVYCTSQEMSTPLTYDYMGRTEDNDGKVHYYRAYTRRPKPLCRMCQAEMVGKEAGRQPVYTAGGFEGNRGWRT